MARREEGGVLLEVEELRVGFAGDRGVTTQAVDAVSFTLRRGATLGLVGESGSGKSVTALAIMGLLPRDSARVSGRVRFEGRDLLALSEAERRNLRGNRMAMIFQEPMTSLNPSYTVADQIGEVLVRHRGLAPAVARAEAIALMDRVRIPSAAARADDYPHRLSAACASG
jgi:peptide/nickel transport system ATP-binding protein